MSDANTGQTVECPICETQFDPTVAGGWCTNTDCGEWQYTDDGKGASVDEPASGGEDVADDSEPTDTAVEAEQSDDEADAETAEADEAPDPDEAEADDQPSTIDCPDCGSTLEVEVNFCPDCGADVQDLEPDAPLTACPSCDSEVDPEDNFCVNCGENLTAHRDGEADAEAEDPIDALESAEATPVPESLVLEVAGREIAVDDGDKIGREIRAALTDAGRPEDEAVRIHREHVRFVREDDSFYLLDLGDNPTELNGQPLQKGDRESVGPGDEIELSGVAAVTVRAP